MSKNEVVTIKVSFTRDELTGKRNPAGNEVLAGQTIFGALRARGVPVIGVLGVLAVEWGTLTIAHEDGLDGDEWAYTFIGAPMPKEWAAKCAKPGRVLRLDNPLAKQIAEAEEL